VAQVVRRDLLHLGTLHRTGEPSIAGLRARQIRGAVITEYEVIEAASLALHRELVEHERRHRHRSLDAALGAADRVIDAELHRVVMDAEPGVKVGFSAR